MVCVNYGTRNGHAEVLFQNTVVYALIHAVLTGVTKKFASTIRQSVLRLDHLLSYAAPVRERKDV